MIRDPARLDALLQQTRAWVRERAIPNEDLVAERDEVPAELVEEMRSHGYFGWSIPEAYGGAGLTTEELVLGALEISQCSVAFRARVGTNTGIGSEGIVADGTEAQKQRYLPRLASGEWTGCLAVTEPDAGSEATNVRTTARRDGAHYVLDGSKCYITNAPLADVFTVTARTELGSRGAKGVSAFIVERSMPGLETGPPYRKMGQAGSPVGEVHFRDCVVPAANLIGGVEGQGFKTVMKTLNKQRIHLA
ncbi:MAG: acyl-CoA dehydrogenase family protein, partial [Pseudomonadota bacterium]|nr:acyl-CoA dehydrogenase family protein [Pseudomonadota bacterium]